MSRVQKSVIDEDEIDTVLESDIRFSGTIETAKSLLIKGRVSGIITCGDELYLTEESLVEADIRALRLTVRGYFKGRAVASEGIQILSGARVDADLEAPEIFIEDRENFSGTATETEPAEHE
jgi:cytoskeletal protein CcmA (bactofilin family)